jgi:hypothetical protein
MIMSFRTQCTSGLEIGFRWIVKLCAGMALGFIVLSWMLQQRFGFTGIELVYNTLYALPLIGILLKKRIGFIGFIIMNILNVFFIEWNLVHIQALWTMFPAVYASVIIHYFLKLEVRSDRKKALNV